MPSFKVRTGINYRPGAGKAEKRAEPGDTVDDIPKKAAEWMLRDGLIEKVQRRDSVWPDSREESD